MTAMTQPPELSRCERLRRVVITCASFGRNLAFYRAGRSPEAQWLYTDLHPQRSFWLQVNSNFVDQAVLEWCKLFGEKKPRNDEYGHGEHGWRRIVLTNQNAFEVGMHRQLGCTHAEFAELVDAMRRLRDKFIAHLDSDRHMDIPLFARAYEAIAYYHDHVVTNENEGNWVLGPPNTAEQFRLSYEALLADTTAMMKRTNLQAAPVRS